MQTAARPVPGTRDGPNLSRLKRDLRAEVDGEVRFDAGTLGAYSTDASNFRRVPLGAVVPRTVEAAVTAVSVCRRHGAPVLSRGGGTSIGLAGNFGFEPGHLEVSRACAERVLLPAVHQADPDTAILVDRLQLSHPDRAAGR